MRPEMRKPATLEAFGAEPAEDVLRGPLVETAVRPHPCHAEIDKYLGRR